MKYSKTCVFIQVPRDLSLSGVWSRSHSILGDRPRDWNQLNNPTSEIRACLASSEKKGEGGYAGEFLVLFHCKAHVVFRVKHHRHILFVIRGRIQRLNGEIFE